MFWSVLLGFFAAFGFLSILWVCCGHFLPGSAQYEVAVFSPAGNELAMIRRFCWLRELGLMRWHLAVVDSGLNEMQQRMITEKFSYIRFVSPEQWLSGHRKEPEDIVPTGNGNIAGLHRRCRISKL